MYIFILCIYFCPKTDVKKNYFISSLPSSFPFITAVCAFTCTQFLLDKVLSYLPDIFQLTGTSFHLRVPRNTNVLYWGKKRVKVNITETLQIPRSQNATDLKTRENALKVGHDGNTLYPVYNMLPMCHTLLLPHTLSLSPSLPISLYPNQS